MSGWKDKIRQQQQKQAAEAAHQDAEKSEAAKLAGMLPEQQAFATRIGNEAICKVLREAHELFTEEPNHPITLIRDDSRTFHTVAVVNGVRIAVNIHLLPSGQVEFAVFGPRGFPEHRRKVTIDTPNEPIEEWIGDCVSSYFTM